MFLKIDVLKKISDIGRKTPVLESLLNKVAGLKFFIIKRLQHMFSGAYCEIFKNSFFTEQFW